MKLLLIYGAPGTGKLTVATELSKEIGYPLFHNHMILNALSEVFGYDHPTRRKLEKEFRLRIVEEAVNADINIIMTGVIMRDNELFYRQVLRLVEANKGDCLLINLKTDMKILKERIEDKSRQELNKISSIKRLEEWRTQYPESFKSIEYPDQLKLDTSTISPQEATSTIIGHYNL